MKKLAYILAAAVLVFSCAKEEINHPSEGQVPEAVSYEPVIAVDQETNQVTFSVDAKAVIPVWVFQASDETWSEYHSGNGFRKIFTKSGDYSVRMHIMNAAGMSPDYVQKSFHIDNTLANFDRYITFLAGGTAEANTKDWHIDGTAEGHMGCGPAGTDGLEWWSAAAGDKTAFGVYEDIMTFGGAGAYTYNPGDDGATYVNKDVTVEPFISQKGDNTEDYNAKVGGQTSKYHFETRGDDLYLVLDANTLFPYIDNDDFWAKPEFKVLSGTRETFELVHDNGGIAWHFIITSKAGPVVFNGFKYNADSNLWLPADSAHSVSYYYAPGWAQIADPEMTFENGEYTLVLPSATSDQWQAQFHITPDTPVVLTADKHYDFSVIVNSNTDIPNMTFKLTDVGDDGNFLFAERESIKAGEQHIFYRSDLEGIDAANGVKMVFDFGGNADGTTVSVAKIVLKDHAVDDGTVLPGNEEPGEVESGAHYDITGATNLWRSATIEEMFYYYAPGWAQIADPEVTADNWHYSFSLPEATSDQWQAQVAFRTSMSSSADKKYDFCCTVVTSQDMPGVTIKLVQTGDDNVFYCADRHKIKANEPFVYKLPNVDGIDMEKISLFFDFGGNPANSDVEIYDICFQEHQEPQGGDGGSGATFDYNSDRNLWKPADAAHTYSQYYAPGWAQIANPAITNNGSTYSFSCPEATSDQWQNQFFIIPDAPIALSAEKLYDFQCKVELSQEVKQVTFKLVDTTDDGNFLFTERRNIAAFEEFVFELKGVAGIDAAAVKMVFDFGGNPAGTDVTIKDIILQEHVGGVDPGPSASEMVYDDPDNFWKAADAAHTYSQYYAPGWTQIANPAITNNGSTYSFSCPEATSDQWQNQFFIIPDAPIALSAEKLYDFQCKVELSQEVKQVTFKLVDTTDDGNFLFTERRNIAAFEEFVFELKGVAGIDAAAVKMVFDFGGNPAGTDVTIKEIILREHK